MNINIVGSSFDAIVAATALAKYGNNVAITSITQKALYDMQWVAAEPALLTTIIELIEVERLNFGSRCNHDKSQITWFFTRELKDLQSVITQHIEQSRPNAIFVSSQHPIGYFDQLISKVESSIKAIGLACPHWALLPFTAREGRGLQDFEYPELFVLGTNSESSRKTAEMCLHPFIKQAKNYVPVSGIEAELIRSCSAAMLATRLSFVNEVASLCETIGADSEVICKAMGFDGRIGPDYLAPGCGFGGQTLPTELDNLRLKLGGGAGAQLLSAVTQTNEQQKEVLFRKFWQYYQADVRDKKVAIWGGAFKAGVSNTDNSAIHPLLRAFWAQDVQTNVFEPLAGVLLGQMYHEQEQLQLAESAYQALEGADALIIVTDHKEFYSPDFEQMKLLLKKAVIFDGRNLYDPQQIHEAGFEYYGIGHGLSTTASNR